MTLPSLLIYVTLSALYFAWFDFVIGIQLKHLMAYSGATICIVGTRTRRLLFDVSPYLMYAAVYDSMRAFPSYKFNRIRIRDLYNFEKMLFSVRVNDTAVLTVNEYFNLKEYAGKFRHQVIWQMGLILCGLFYINWLTIPLGYAVYLYMLDKKRYAVFSAEFILLNFLGFAIYYIYPAAPPWYVCLYGFEMRKDVRGNAANLAMIDEMLGFRIFQSIYSQNSNTFASMPSLHSAYPMLCLLSCIHRRSSHGCTFFSVCCVGIWVAAVYTGHHYVVDVIAGIACAISVFVFIDILVLSSYTKCTCMRLVHAFSRYTLAIRASNTKPRQLAITHDDIKHFNDSGRRQLLNKQVSTACPATMAKPCVQLDANNRKPTENQSLLHAECSILMLGHQQCDKNSIPPRGIRTIVWRILRGTWLQIL